MPFISTVLAFVSNSVCVNVGVLIIFGKLVLIRSKHYAWRRTVIRGDKFPFDFLGVKSLMALRAFFQLFKYQKLYP